MAAVNVTIPAEIQRIIDKPSAYLVATEVGPVLQLSDPAIRAQARAGMLPFPAVVVGQRVRIPKIPFLRWLGYDVKVDFNKEDVIA